MKQRCYRSLRDVEEEMIFLKSREDLDSGNGYFKPAGDLEESYDGVTRKDIEDYLSMVTSGEKYDYESELGTLYEGGRMFVSFDKLKEMVDEGYNIISGKCISTGMIEIEYQGYKKSDSKKRG